MNCAKHSLTDLMVLEKLEDGQHDVVGVTEAGRLGFLGVVQASHPVDGNVRLLLVDLQSSRCKHIVR